MYKEETGQTPGSSNAKRPKADAFLNISVTDANGTEHKLRAGIPMHATNGLEAKLMQLLGDNPDFDLGLKATLHIVKETKAEDFNF